MGKILGQDLSGTVWKKMAAQPCKVVGFVTTVAKTFSQSEKEV